MIIKVPNQIHGRFTKDNVKVAIEPDYIYVQVQQETAIQVFEEEQPTRLPRRYKEPESTQDRLAKSTHKTVKFLNDFFWGEQ